MKNGYEAHKECIYIQYLTSGTEKVCSLPLEYIKETKVYKKEIDVSFYEEKRVEAHTEHGNGFLQSFILRMDICHA